MRILACLSTVWAGIGVSHVGAAVLPNSVETCDFNATDYQKVPVSGHHAPGVDLLDAIMLRRLKEIGCTGATLTVARGRHTLYSLGASTPALCTFMRCLWLDGRPRDKGNPVWFMGGSWDNSTTAMIWRADGINVAWSFNGRKNDVDPGEELWKRAIDQLVKEKRLPK